MRIVDQLETVGDWLRYAATRFEAADLHYGHGTDNAWDEAVALVRGELKLPDDKLGLVLAARLTRGERNALARKIEQRIAKRVPVPYLVGEAYFAGRRYRVTKDVLIPRSPIAELIENEFAPWLAHAPATILDLGAGSGCIGIACAHQFPAARVVLSDVDPRALDVARANVALHRVEDRVDVVASDVFAGLPRRRFDLIVTNPPYVAAAEWRRLPREHRHEPARALAAGAKGLDVVLRIVDEAKRHLTKSGALIGEVGASAANLAKARPKVPFEWPSFERGGDGVFVIGAASLPGRN